MSNDQRPMLAFFTSDRSGPARRMESVLSHLSRKERSRLRVTLIDIDKRPEIAERLGVSVVPTLVLIKDKRVVDRIEGRASAPRIERMIESHLEPVELESGGATVSAAA